MVNDTDLHSYINLFETFSFNIMTIILFDTPATVPGKALSPNVWKARLIHDLSYFIS